MRLIYVLFAFFCFFPYLQLLPVETDTQPNAIIMGVISLVLFFISGEKIKWNRKFSMLAFIALLAVLVMAIDNEILHSIRCVANYVGLFVVSYAWYLFRVRFGCLPRLWKVAVLSWGIIGIVQLFYDPSFMLFLVPRDFTGEQIGYLLQTGRGVLSLAPEPTFYGFVCICLILYAFLNYESIRNSWVYIIILFLQIIFLARSSASILIIVIASLFYYFLLLLYGKVGSVSKVFYGILIPIIVIAVLLVSTSLGGRINQLSSGGIENDVSVNQRIAAITYSFQGSLDRNLGLPNGFVHFDEYRIDKGYFAYTNYRNGVGDRIMSGIGGLFFQLGFFVGLFFLLWFFRFYFRFYKDSITKATAVLVLFLVLMNAFSLGLGIVGMLFGELIVTSEIFEEDETSIY